MNNMQRIFTFLSLALITGVSHASLIYINQSSDPEGIYVVEQDGTGLETVVEGPNLRHNAGRAIAINSIDGLMFYSQTEQGIFRAYLDGSNIQRISSKRYVTDIEVDETNKRLFYATVSGTIFVTDFYGTIETSIGSGAARGGIAYDSTSDSIFYSGYAEICCNNTRSLTISRLDLTTGVSFDVVDLGAGSGPIYSDVEIGDDSGTLYWSDRSYKRFGTMASDGSSLNVLYEGVGDFWGPIAVDESTGKLFYTPVDPDSLAVAALDGSGTSVLLQGPPFGTMSIALGPDAELFDFPPDPPSVTAPEPPMIALFALSLAGVGYVRRVKGGA